MSGNHEVTDILAEMEKNYIKKFVELVKEHGEFWQDSGQNSEQTAQKIKPFLHHLSDEELNILAKRGHFLVAQAVADFLVPRIAKLDVKERIALGQVITYHRIWTALINTPLPNSVPYELEEARHRFEKN